MAKQTECKIVQMPAYKDVLAELEEIIRFTKKRKLDEFTNVWQALEDSRPAIEARIKDLERLTEKTDKSGNTKGSKGTRPNVQRGTRERHPPYGPTTGLRGQ